MLLQNNTNLSLLFLQCPAPAWPDCVHGRAPAPASHPLRALGAAHTPTRSVGAHTLMSPWIVFPTAMWTTSQSPLRWHVRAPSTLNPMHLYHIIPHYINPDSFPLSCPFICTILKGHRSHLHVTLLYPLFLHQFNHHFQHLSQFFLSELLLYVSTSVSFFTMFFFFYLCPYTCPFFSSPHSFTRESSCMLQYLSWCILHEQIMKAECIRSIIWQ